MSDNMSTREQCIRSYASVIELWFCDHNLPVCDNLKFAELLHDARLKMVGPVISHADAGNMGHVNRNKLTFWQEHEMDHVAKG